MGYFFLVRQLSDSFGYFIFLGLCTNQLARGHLLYFSMSCLLVKKIELFRVAL